MELRQLHYLTVIADEENLGRAAQRLYVNQPALSYALKSLESELGVRLFDRHAGGVSATDSRPGGHRRGSAHGPPVGTGVRRRRAAPAR